jgi:competence protein ComEC
VIAPDSSWTARQDDANETSVVLRVAYGAVSFLLTGDAESNEERWMLEHADTGALHADVLKVGHHGSRTSSSPAFLDAVQPRLGLVSVGEDNRYGHPSPQTLAEFARRGIPLLRTDREGAIVVRTDGHVVQVQTRGDRWTVGSR